MDQLQTHHQKPYFRQVGVNHTVDGHASVAGLPLWGGTGVVIGFVAIVVGLYLAFPRNKTTFRSRDVDKGFGPDSLV